MSYRIIAATIMNILFARAHLHMVALCPKV